MADTFERFKHLFRRSEVVLTLVDVEQERERREELRTFVRSMREFMNNVAYTEYRNRVQQRIVNIRPNTELGLDAAAATAFRQEGLREALDVLDNMVLEAQEALDGLGTDDAG